MPAIKNESGTIRQKRPSVSTSDRRPPCCRLLSQGTSGGVLRVQITIDSATSKVTTAPIAKAVRQPKVLLSQASGVAATSAPLEPMPTSRPETVAKRWPGNHWLNALNDPIKMPPMPSPINARPSASTPNEVAPAKSRLPATPASIKPGVTQRAPQRSSPIPTGI